jgi:hypothetical protein
MYRSICDTFGGRRTVFSTLNVGGEKPAPFVAVTGVGV